MTKPEKKTVEDVRKMTIEEEKAYFNSIDPLRRGDEVEAIPVKGRKGKHLSLLTMRIDPRDLTRIVESAKKKHMNTSELVRSFIIEGLDRDEKAPTLEERVEAIEEQLALKRAPVRKKTGSTRPKTPAAA